jgi:hypothetical protein
MKKGALFRTQQITTRPAIFDDHFESHQLLLPDSPLFRAMVGPGGA